MRARISLPTSGQDQRSIITPDATPADTSGRGRPQWTGVSYLSTGWVAGKINIILIESLYQRKSGCATIADIDKVPWRAVCTWGLKGTKAVKLKALLIYLSLCATISFGQAGLATVTGTIADSSGAVVANAPIEVRNTETGAIFKAASSDTGNFTVSQLPVGDYDLVVAVQGFKTYEHKGFHLAAQQTMREDVSLQVGQSAESVTVTAEASLLKNLNARLPAGLSTVCVAEKVEG